MIPDGPTWTSYWCEHCEERVYRISNGDTGWTHTNNNPRDHEAEPRIELVQRTLV